MRIAIAVVAMALVAAACSDRLPAAPDAVAVRDLPGSASATAFPDQQQGGRPISTPMIGAEEAPGPGDPDGSGNATFTFNPGQEEVCFSLTVSDIAPATAAHIHRAPPGEPGPVVVGLTPPTSGSSEGCVSADRELVIAIMQDPAAYYVNVHNADFPAGAVRGQLSK